MEKVINISNLTSNISNGWIVTKDHGVCNDCDNATAEQISEIKKMGLIHHFKMYDDDGNLYYSGYSENDSSFDPMDDFGTPNAGCTEIRYKNKQTGQYEIL